MSSYKAVNPCLVHQDLLGPEIRSEINNHVDNSTPSFFPTRPAQSFRQGIYKDLARTNATAEASPHHLLHTKFASNPDGHTEL